jgi:Tfp pilus assembly protein PilN
MVRHRIFEPASPRQSAGVFSPRCAVGAFFTGVLLLCGGCAMAPRAQMDACQQIGRTLRSENARLKDQILALEAQNHDYADRALDDSRRLVSQDEALEHLEKSVQAYQDERARLESAFHQLTASLGETRAQSEDRLTGAVIADKPQKKARAKTSSDATKDGEAGERVR